MACQFVKGYLMLGGYRILFILRSYLHFLCSSFSRSNRIQIIFKLINFAHGPIEHESFLNRFIFAYGLIEYEYFQTDQFHS